VSALNPDLPILDELGAEFEALVTAAWADGGRTAPTLAGGPVPVPAADPEPGGPASDDHMPRRRAPLPAPRRSRERGAQARRVGRRAAIVLVLLCLVGGVAFAAFRGAGSGGHGNTSPALLGKGAGGAWTLSAYRDEGKLCTVFVPAGGELSGNCGAFPGAGRLRAGSAVAGGHRYVFGVAGPAVARASVSLSAEGLTRATWRTGAAGVRRPVDPEAAKDAGLPAGDGWFVLDLGPVGRGRGAAAPAIVVPLTRHGHRGPPYVDCSLGVLNAACERRIESIARG
jgi:hypothetical protein